MAYPLVRQVAHLTGVDHHEHNASSDASHQAELSKEPPTESFKRRATHATNFLKKGSTMKTLSELAKVAEEHEDNVEDMKVALQALRQEHPKEVSLYQCLVTGIPITREYNATFVG